MMHINVLCMQYFLMYLVLPDDDPERPKYVNDDDDDNDKCQLSANAFCWTTLSNT